MKRAWLIAGGTVGGLGAVLAITPPQLSSDNASAGLEFTPTPTQTAAATTEPTPATTESAQATKPFAPVVIKALKTGNMTGGVSLACRLMSFAKKTS